MPDITMCFSEECNKKNKCYRYLAKPDILQSYSNFFELEGSNCKYFWEVADERQCKSSKSLSK